MNEVLKSKQSGLLRSFQITTRQTRIVKRSNTCQRMEGQHPTIRPIYIREWEHELQTDHATSDIRRRIEFSGTIPTEVVLDMYKVMVEAKETDVTPGSILDAFYKIRNYPHLQYVSRTHQQKLGLSTEVTASWSFKGFDIKLYNFSSSAKQAQKRTQRGFCLWLACQAPFLPIEKKSTFGHEAPEYSFNEPPSKFTVGKQQKYPSLPPLVSKPPEDTRNLFQTLVDLGLVSPQELAERYNITGMVDPVKRAKEELKRKRKEHKACRHYDPDGDRYYCHRHKCWVLCVDTPEVLKQKIRQLEAYIPKETEIWNRAFSDGHYLKADNMFKSFLAGLEDEMADLKKRLECIEENPGPGKKKIVEEIVVAKPQRQRKPRVKKTIVVQAATHPTHRAILPSNGVMKKAELVKVPAVKKAMTQPRTKRFNRYLATLVDPEGFPGVRFPDTYDRATATVQGIIEENLYYFPDGSTKETPGSFYVAWRPSLAHPLWVYRASTGPTGPPVLCLTSQTERFGLVPVGDGVLSPTQQDNQMIIQSDVVYNVKAPMTWGNVDYVNDPFLSSAADGTDVYGYPLSGFSGTVSCLFTVHLNGVSVQVGDTLTMYVTNGSTTISNSIAATANGQGDFKVPTTDISAFFGSDGGNANLGLCVGRPGLGIRMMFTSGNANMAGLAVESLSWNCWGSTAGTTQQLVCEPIDLPDQAQYLAKVTNYRPVSSSAWVAYEGSDLNNGGQLAALMYRGGEHPNQVGLWNYKNIAAVSGAHEGPLKLGSYQFWVPASTEDTKMRKTVNANEWTHPYMVVAGIAATPSQVNALRIRAVVNYEFVSKAQIWSYQATKPNPQAIAHAAIVLHGRRTSMENPNHWAVIKSYLAKAVETAKNFGTWIDENRGWIVPAVGAATALLA